MLTLRINFNPPLSDRAASFRRLSSSGLYESLARVGKDADDALLSALMAEAPVRSGHFQSTIHSVQLAHGAGSLSYEYRAENPLSSWIINGTRPHTIDAAPGGVLAFLGASGDIVFTRHVNHPGTQPNDFPRRAWESAENQVVAAFSRLGRDISEQLN